MKKLLFTLFCFFLLLIIFPAPTHAVVGAICEVNACSDESATEYCDNTTKQCVGKVATNQPCSNDIMCLSGKCVNNKCAESVAAASPAAGATPAGTASPAPGTAAASPAGPAAASVPHITIPNFLGITDPNDLIARLIKVILGLSGTLALIMFIWGGILFMLAAGDPKKVADGTKAMLYSAAGLVVIFTSYIVVNQLLNLFIK